MHSVVEPWSLALAIIGTEMSKLYYEICMHKAIGLWEFGRCPTTWPGPQIKYNFQMTDTSEIIKNLSMYPATCCHKADMKKFFETPLQIPEDGSPINILSCTMYIWDRVMNGGPRRFRCVHVNMRTRTARFIVHRHRMPYNPDSEWICIDRELYEQMHRHVFKHTYVRFGDQAYVQTLGTPIGVAASVDNSHNFLCTFDELNIDYLVSVNKFEEAARWSLF